MPIDASPSGTLDIENATLRSREIVALTNMVAGNDVVRSGGPALEVYGDPGPRLELVSNTAATDGTATFTRLESNVGVFSIQSGADASTNGPITFGGFSNERMRITADGRVGIGTTSPLSELDIYNSAGAELIVSRNASSSVNPTIRLWNFDDNNYNNHNIGTSVGTISFSGNERLTGDTHTDDSRAFSYANTLYDWARISALYVGSSDSATTSQGYVRGDLAFYTNNGDGATSDLQERMRIKHDGNVGIGTTDPSSILNTYGGDLWDGADHTSQVCATLQVGRGAGVGDSAADQDTGAILEFRHSSDYRYVTIESVSEQTYSQDIGLRFKTVDGTGGPVERMRIDASGNVGIGTTDPESALDVVGPVVTRGGSGTSRFYGGYISTDKDIWRSTGTSLNGSAGGGTVLFLISGNYSSGTNVVSYAWIVHKMYSGAENNTLQATLLSQFEGDGGTGVDRRIDIRVNPTNGDLEFRCRNTSMNIQYTILENQ